MTDTSFASPTRIRFWQHHANGDLTVFPEDLVGVPFPILRVFTIAGVSAGGRRANHAHRRCSQLLACLAGNVTVEISDGKGVSTEVLRPDGEALLIPPFLWNSVIFDSPQAVLAVFCDRLYEEDDYLRDWDEYLRIRQGIPA